MSLAKHPSSTVQILGAEKAPDTQQAAVGLTCWELRFDCWVSLKISGFTMLYDVYDVCMVCQYVYI